MENGEEKEEVFEMVVLLNGFKFSETNRKILKMFDVDIGANVYIESEEDFLARTDSPYVYLAGYKIAEHGDKEETIVHEKLSY